MTARERIAVARVMTELIKSDDIIESHEIGLFFDYCRAYRISDEELAAAAALRFADAVTALGELSRKERTCLLERLRLLMVSDGIADGCEVRMLLALEMCLGDRWRSRCRLVSTAVTDAAVDAGTIVYTETSYDADVNAAIVAARDTIAREMTGAGLRMAYIPQVAASFGRMDAEELRRVIAFLAPDADTGRRAMIFETLRTVTTAAFTTEVLAKKLGLADLLDSEPSLLMQVDKSTTDVTYLIITVGADIAADICSIARRYRELVTPTTCGVLPASPSFVYRGFHRALFDLLAFPGQKIESRILVDPGHKQVLLMDLNCAVSLPTGRLALYMFIIRESVCSKARELPVGDVGDKRRMALCRTFHTIYGMMSDNPGDDFLSNLTPTLSHIRRAVRAVDNLDHPELYMPERRNGAVRVMLSPDKVFVRDNGAVVPMADSGMWRKMGV